MKITRYKLSVVTTLMAMLLGLTGTAFAQQTMSISPSVISNSYPGFLTLQIGGLTNGETVNVQTYLDLNSNGVVDAGEPMLDAFSITDNGSNGVAGTVTNVNIPIDHNPAGGAITATLNVAPPLTLANIVGQQIYQVSSPTARFAPVTTTFVVTNAPTAQSISGTVLAGGAPVPNAVVVAMIQPNGEYAGATVADGAGNYSLNLDPGNYGVLSVLPNYYTDQSAAPQFTLTNGMNATNSLFMTNGLVANTISGQIYNSANSNGVPGVFVQLQSGNLFTVAFSDASGNYSAPVNPSFWKIKPAKERLPRRAYLVSQNGLQVDATAGSVTGANVPLYKGNALMYGHITDVSNTPLANIIFDANDNNSQFAAKGYSDANGNYAVAVLAITNDSWYCNANSSVALTDYILNNFQNTNVSIGSLIQENFVALPITAHISGRVLDKTGNPVTGVSLLASTFDNSYQSQNQQTDSSGNYSLGVASGAWYVSFSDGGESGLDTAGFVDLYGPYGVTVPPTNNVLNITVYPIGTALISQPQRMSSAQFGFTINGAPNVSYTVQVSTNLATNSWANLFSLTLTNNSFPVVDPNATNKMRFYRILKN